MSVRPRRRDGSDEELYVSSATMLAQPLMEGRRVVATVVADGRVTAVDRLGRPFVLSDAVKGALAFLGALNGAGVYDGVTTHERYAIFDVLERNGINVRAWPTTDRIELLDSLDLSGMEGILVPRTARTREERIAMAREVEAGDGLGVVMKDPDAPYDVDLQNPWVALRFVPTAICWVAGRPVAGSREVPLIVTGRLGIAAIADGEPIPEPGAFVAVRHAGGDGLRLRDAVILGIRTDVDNEDCDTARIGDEVSSLVDLAWEGDSEC